MIHKDFVAVGQNPGRPENLPLKPALAAPARRSSTELSTVIVDNFRSASPLS
jgi:hypothetical protein